MLNRLNDIVVRQLRIHRPSSQTTFLIQVRSIKSIDRSKVPVLNEADLEEQFVSGSGPGGQCVNKAVNCCYLKHKPTGLHVKVHHQRSLRYNRAMARQLLVEKLDNLYNGEDSVENQKKRVAINRIAIKTSEAERRLAMKREYKNNILGLNRSPSSSVGSSHPPAGCDDNRG